MSNIVQRHRASSLPILFARAFGGCEKQATQVALAWSLLRHAATVLDNIQDSKEGHLDMQLRLDLNGSSGLIFGACLLLNDLTMLQVDEHTTLEISQAFHRVGLQTASGQHLDLVGESADLDVVWEIIFRKTADVGALACWAGARLATVQKEALDLSWKYGFVLGVLEQIKNDFKGLWESKDNDIVCGKLSSLPIAYALSVLDELRRDKLHRYLEDSAENKMNELAARKLIIESGAIAYLVVQSTNYYEQGEVIINSMEIANSVKATLSATITKLRLQPPNTL